MMRPSIFLSGVMLASVTPPSLALEGGVAGAQINVQNGWKAFEVISQGNNVPGDGFGYSMPATFDGAGAYFVDASTLRILVNHETSDASISAVEVDVAGLKKAIANVISNGETCDSFVTSARQGYGRYSANGGSTWINTESTATTSFSRFCSGQAYAPDTFGTSRGFVDHVYITGEETSGGKLFALDPISRDLYLLSGVIGSAPGGGTGGMPFDAWENAALIDTGETEHVALLLSPDGGTQTMQLYIGEKGKGFNGAASSSFLARNGLAYGSWYWLIDTFPASVGPISTDGSFSTSSTGGLKSDKLEDVDTSPTNPTKVALGDQTSGTFVLDFSLVFNLGSFDAFLSSFTVQMIDIEGGTLNSADNLDWTAATTLDGQSYPEGLIFVNEDNSSGEIWQMNPDGSNKVLVGSTKVGAESTGIFDLSEFVGQVPGSILITNNQGSPSSMTVLIHPGALDTGTGTVCGDGTCEGCETLASCAVDCDTCGNGVCDAGIEDTTNCFPDCGSNCGDGTCNGLEDTINCVADCGSSCGDGVCNGGEDTTNCVPDCGDFCGDGVCNGSETVSSCSADCPLCFTDQNSPVCTPTTNCCSGVGNCSGGKPSRRTCRPGGNQPGCGSSADCDDSNVCTTDTCNSGSCSNDPIPGCGPSCGQNKDSCNSNSDCCSLNCKGGGCKGNGRRLGHTASFEE